MDDERPNRRRQRGAPLSRVAVVAGAGYLAGSIPVAGMVARRHAVDLRAAGDGNPGFWNARALLGTRRALPVFAGDMTKGTVAGVGGRLAGGGALTYVGVGSAMVGHALPIFARGRGGRAVLTYVGGLAAISPPAFVVSWAICLGVTAATGSFAIGARAGVFSSPAVQLAVERDPRRLAATGALLSFIGLRFLLAAHSRGRANGALGGASAR